MRTLSAVSPNTVFIKTPKGREEVSQRHHELSPSQRRVLIVIDGIKNFNALIALIPAIIASHELEQIVSFLLQQGFIASAEHSANKPKLVVLEKPVAAASQPAAALYHVAPLLSVAPAVSLASPSKSESMSVEDTVILRKVKDFMSITAHTYLGLLSAEVIHRIERAKDKAQLMMVVGHWHMALRESKEGKRFAGPYLEQVKVTLSGGKSVFKEEYLMAQ